MTATKEELQERAQLVRGLEAVCRIEYPTPDEANFRIALMKRVGLAFHLKEVRNTTIDGPIDKMPSRPAIGTPTPGRDLARRSAVK